MNVFFSRLTKVSCITFLSRILGFIRDILIAKEFGASIESDAFFIAFKISNMPRSIFAEGAFSQVFIPLLSKYKVNYKKKSVKIFISNVIGWMLLILITIIIIVEITAPKIISIITPGIVNNSKRFSLTILLLRIIFPYILFISISCFFNKILNIWNFFSITAFTPSILSISIIIFIIFFSSKFHYSIIGLSYTIIFGGIIQFVYQLPFLKKIDMIFTPCLYSIFYFEIKKIFQKISTLVPGIFVSQLSTLINMSIMSFFKSGAISWIYYANRLIELPLGIFNANLETIIFPYLSKNYLQGNYKNYSYLIDCSFRISFIISIPYMIIIIIFSRPLISTLFQYGKFSVLDILMTQISLISSSIGLLGFFLTRIMITGFYSSQDIKTPIRIFILIFVITQIFNLILIKFLKHASLPLSMSLSSYFHTFLLYKKIRKRKLFSPEIGWKKFFLQLIFSIIIMSTICIIENLTFKDDFFLKTHILIKFLRLFIVIFTGIISYIIALKISGVQIEHLFSFKKES